MSSYSLFQSVSHTLSVSQCKLLSNNNNKKICNANTSKLSMRVSNPSLSLFVNQEDLNRFSKTEQYTVSKGISAKIRCLVLGVHCNTSAFSPKSRCYLILISFGSGVESVFPHYGTRNGALCLEAGSFPLVSSCLLL